jgi:hypothetical protein
MGENTAKMQQPRNFFEIISSFSFRTHKIAPTLQVAILASESLTYQPSQLAFFSRSLPSGKQNKKSPQNPAKVQKREQGV